MEQEYSKLYNSLVSIASEAFRFRQVFHRALGKLDNDEQVKYKSQYEWFYKKVSKALDEANLKLIDPLGELYDPGMAVTPLNIDDFETDDKLYVLQTIEPIIMHDEDILKTGKVILGSVKR